MLVFGSPEANKIRKIDIEREKTARKLPERFEEAYKWLQEAHEEFLQAEDNFDDARSRVEFLKKLAKELKVDVKHIEDKFPL